MAENIRGLADRVEPHHQPIRQPPEDLHSDAPVVGSDDPWSSEVAAERIEPKRTSRKGQVLAYLRQRSGAWVDGYELTTQAVGGSEGLRRLRELRANHGFPIERRPHPTSATAWQYRLPTD